MRTWATVLTAVVTLLVAAGAGNAQIIHRYSFTTDASDSVGTADGTLVGGATVSGGQLQLDGMTGYLTLPIGNDLGTLTSATFEGWATWAEVQTWSRLFDFGNDTVENMFLTPRNGNNNRVRFSITVNGGGDEEQTTSGLHFPIGVETHFAVTIDADFGIDTLYINGNPAAITFGAMLTPNSLTAPTLNNYLGKSQYNDPFFHGSINEFRIYAGALSAGDVMASFQAGPDAP